MKTAKATTSIRHLIWHVTLYGLAPARAAQPTNNDCTLAVLTNGQCTLTDFCEYVLHLEGSGNFATCEAAGSLAAKWSLVLTEMEECHYNATAWQRERDGVYDPAVFNADNGDWCAEEEFVVELVRDAPMVARYTEIFTHPIQGNYTIQFPLIHGVTNDKCHEELLDFLPTTCVDYSICPTWYMNDQLCTSSCIFCPLFQDDVSSEPYYLTCTNLDPMLVNFCQEFDSNFDPNDILYKFLAYFTKVNNQEVAATSTATNSPTHSPSAYSEKPGTSAPTNSATETLLLPTSSPRSASLNVLDSPLIAISTVHIMLFLLITLF